MWLHNSNHLGYHTLFCRKEKKFVLGFVFDVIGLGECIATKPVFADFKIQMQKLHDYSTYDKDFNFLKGDDKVSNLLDIKSFSLMITSIDYRSKKKHFLLNFFSLRERQDTLVKS